MNSRDFSSIPFFNAASSPEPFNSVSIQRSVAAHERQVLRQTLCDEHPVKGIAVVQRQASDPEGVFRRNVEQGETVGRELFGKKFFQGFPQGELAEAGLDGQFSNAGQAEEPFRVRGFQDHLRQRAQLRGIGHEPQERVRVGENFHSM